MSGDCWLYKAYRMGRMPDDDVLLYVGISDSPDERMSQHCKTKWWWHLVQKLEWYRLSGRDTAALNEQRLIAKERPLFNKAHSVVTSAEVLCGCLGFISYSFKHCPLCHTSCMYSEVQFVIKGLCRVDVRESEEAFCFEVLMSCDKNHSPIQWTQFVPIHALAECETRVPEDVLAELWSNADDNGEVGEDIPPLRPQTLMEMFASGGEESNAKNCLIESK